MRQILSAIFFLLACIGLAQVAPDKYFIQFTDKNGTPYSISDPGQFLTQRAIDRRVRQGIAVTEQDLPVTPSYVETISSYGVTVLTRSKWFNGITIYCNSQAALDSISALPFVLNVVKNSKPVSGTNKPDRKLDFIEKIPYLKEKSSPMTGSAGLSFDYGPSYNQIHMLNGDLLHDAGYRGQGMVIAVIDAGFLNADSLDVFDSLRAGGQILGTSDFVLPHNDVYNEFSHGTIVLSTMGGNLPGIIIGTAPKASYWLLRSEDVSSENLIEEYNWVSAAEFADSVGADVINSSLGYTTFDDTTKNHTCADITGNTTPATRGANIAASKGMVVSCSAGNLGGSSWTCPAAPSDGYRIMGIAAVDSLGIRASFSCEGFNHDTLIKPTVAAQGVATFAAGTDNGTFIYASGTSLSSPLIAGMSACLWQTNPDVPWNIVIHDIEESASHYNTPDTLTGYGIPDFYQAMSIMGIHDINNGSSARVFPNPFKDFFTIELPASGINQVEIRVYDILGNQVYQKAIFTGTGEKELQVTGLGKLSPGFYLLTYSSGNLSGNIRLIKTAE